jgi:hypothetical protein
MTSLKSEIDLVPTNRPIPATDYVEHFDPDLQLHRAWLLAVLEQPPAHGTRAAAPAAHCS